MVPERVHWAVEQLGVLPSDRVLEIGTGPGYALGLIAEKLQSGTITGIDRSPLQVQRARDRNAAHLKSERARIECLTLVRAPDKLGNEAFDRVLAINVNAFWTDAEASLTALVRLLQPDGAVCLVYEPPDLPRLEELRDSLPARLENHGLSVTRITTRPFRQGHGICFLAKRARKPA